MHGPLRHTSATLRRCSSARRPSTARFQDADAVGNSNRSRSASASGLMHWQHGRRAANRSPTTWRPREPPFKMRQRAKVTNGAYARFVRRIVDQSRCPPTRPLPSIRGRGQRDRHTVDAIDLTPHLVVDGTSPAVSTSNPDLRPRRTRSKIRPGGRAAFGDHRVRLACSRSIASASRAEPNAPAARSDANRASVARRTERL